MSETEKRSLWPQLKALLIKIFIVALGAWVIFTFIFGIYRCNTVNMEPAFKDGDLVFYFRRFTDLSSGDVVIVQYKDELLIERVVAVEGDTVDITERGLIVNGSHVQESRIYTETTQFSEGISFPVEVPEGCVFLLGDNRERATDSRIFGCAEIKDIKGTVVVFLRRRNL